jgi:hypothetical protein
MPKERRGNKRGIREGEGTSVPPHVDALRPGDLAVNGPADLTADMIDRLDHREGPLERHLDEEEADSFPASDPHSDWVGPPK